MTIRYSRTFVKQIAKQPKNVQKAFYARLRIFMDDPYDPLLRNHPLTGELAGCHSINITGDIRAIYRTVDDEMYVYQMIGSHSQLYG